MKTKPIPAIIMLIAGFITCLYGLLYHVDLFHFTKNLLIVLVVFYILGSVVKLILDINFNKMEPEEKTDEIENIDLNMNSEEIEDLNGDTAETDRNAAEE